MIYWHFVVPLILSLWLRLIWLNLWSICIPSPMYLSFHWQFGWEANLMMATLIVKQWGLHGALPVTANLLKGYSVSYDILEMAHLLHQAVWHTLFLRRTAQPRARQMSILTFCASADYKSFQIIALLEGVCLWTLSVMIKCHYSSRILDSSLWVFGLGVTKRELDWDIFSSSPEAGDLFTQPQPLPCCVLCKPGYFYQHLAPLKAL